MDEALDRQAGVRRQSDEENRIYYEPRCIEGNLGLPGLLHGRRVEERAFAEGRGPDPRTKDSVGGVASVQDGPAAVADAIVGLRALSMRKAPMFSGAAKRAYGPA